MPLAMELSNKLVPKQIDQSGTISSALDRIENEVGWLHGDMKIKIHVQKVNKETGGRELQQYEWAEKE